MQYKETGGMGSWRGGGGGRLRVALVGAARIKCDVRNDKGKWNMAAYWRRSDGSWWDIGVVGPHPDSHGSAHHSSSRFIGAFRHGAACLPLYRAWYMTIPFCLLLQYCVSPPRTFLKTPVCSDWLMLLYTAAFSNNEKQLQFQQCWHQFYRKKSFHS